MPSIADAIQELQTRRQWVCWLTIPRGETSTKPPINPHVDHRLPLKKRLADPTDSTTWSTYALARTMSRQCDGIGFMFAETDPYVGIDLDKCRDTGTGALEEWARRIVERLNSYTELSPSGTGIHIILRASLLATIEKLGRDEIQHKSGSIEIYDRDRYFTVTGKHLAGSPSTIEDRQEELNDLYLDVFPQERGEKAEAGAPQSGVRLTLDDEFIIEQAGKARGGNGAKFTRLWNGDAGDYLRSDGSIDQSRADQALLGILAYWTQKDPVQMERLFMRSHLYRHDRWSRAARSGETYGQGSIRLAIEHCHRVYDPVWAEAHRDKTRSKHGTASVGTERQTSDEIQEADASYDRITLFSPPDVLDPPEESESTDESLIKKKEQLEILSRIPTLPSDQVSPHLSVMNFQPDQAIRQATLARPEQWKQENALFSYRASNDLLVYLGDKKHPLPVEEALKTIRQFSTTTVVTARIVLALWHLRRHEAQLSKSGSAPIRLDEILTLRGVKKQTVIAYPGTEIRYSNGYRTEDKQAILNDLSLLEHCYVRGKCTVCINGRWQTFFVDDEYLRSSVVYRETVWGQEVVGLFVSAGDWINVYEESGNIYLAEVERSIFHLNPQNEQHELRIALYLTERWREQARTQTFDTPITMERLLEESIIPVDRKHLTDRFIPRIEDALNQLHVKGILGSAAHCLTPADHSQPRWAKCWLAAEWVLLPPEDIIMRYRPIAVPALLHSQRRAQKQSRKKGGGEG
jgi:primase-polymerase (primpol)-like protein